MTFLTNLDYSSLIVGALAISGWAYAVILKMDIKRLKEIAGDGKITPAEMLEIGAIIAESIKDTSKEK